MQLCEISTRFGLTMLLALIEAGRLQASGPRVLLVSNHSHDPEAGDPLLDFARSASTVARVFDHVVSLNQLIAPLHPAGWRAPKDPIDQLALKSLLEAAIGQGPVTQLVAESIQTPPSATLAQICADAEVQVYADGLMVYSPTRSALPVSVLSRIGGLHYPDLVPGLRPALLREAAVVPRPLDTAALRAAFALLASDAPLPAGLPALDDVPVFLGQYLTSLNLCTPEEEALIYASGLYAMSERMGSRRVVFRPHPSFPAGQVAALLRHPLLAGLDVDIFDTAQPLESALLAARPACLASVFSTGLVAGSAIFGLPGYSHGTEQFLNRLTPWENSNRVPAALVLWLYPDLSDTDRPRPEAAVLQDRLDRLATTMQPNLLLSGPEDLAALRDAPGDPADPLDTTLRERLANLSPTYAPARLRRALHGQPFDPAYLPPDPETAGNEPFDDKPIALAQTALREARWSEAFAISLKALKKTPSSSLHIKVLRETVPHLGLLHRLRYYRTLARHLGARIK